MKNSEIVKMVLKNNKMTEQELADLLGCADRSTVNKWKSGNLNPNKQALILMMLSPFQINECKQLLRCLNKDDKD